MERLKYDAFISYRHAELDSYAAITLHKQLEAFRLPKSIIRKRPHGSKTGINRVFRDQDELPLASNLAEPIMQALRESEYLIVVCSPRLHESIWCRKEIDTFIEMHGQDHILTVLVEGEPEQSFPENLRYAKKEVIGSDGRTTTELVPVEPLAADVRGSTKKEIRRKMKKEILRLVAPMFQLNYDDLKQRHRERRLKRIAAAVMSVSSISLIFGAVSTTMALRIHSQSVKIENQSEKISEQYQQELVTRSQSLADMSLDLLETGDRTQAMLAAMEALPGSISQPDIPYTAEAVYALTEASYLYKNNEQILPVYLLDQDAEVRFLKLSEAGNYMISGDSRSNLCVWDTVTGEMCYEYNTGLDSIFFTEDLMAFVDDKRIIYPTRSGLEIYDLSLSKVTLELTDLSYSRLACSIDGTYFALVGWDNTTLTVFDTSDGKQRSSCSISDGDIISDTPVFDDKNSMLAFPVTDDTMSEHSKSRIIVMDPATGAVLHDYASPASSVDKIGYEGNLLIAVTNEGYSLRSSGAEADGGICAFDLTTKSKQKWYYKSKGTSIDDFKIITIEGKRNILFSCFSTLGMISAKDGLFLSEVSFSSQIINFNHIKDSSIALVFTRDGVFHFIQLNGMKDFVFIEKFQCNSVNVKEFHYGNDFFVSLPHGSSQMTIYRYAKGSDVKEFAEPVDSSCGVDVNEEETILLAAGTNQINMLDLNSQKVLTTITTDSTISGISFVGENSKSFAVVTLNSIMLYDSSAYTVIKTIDFENEIYDFLGFSQDKSYVYLKSYLGFAVYDLMTGELKYKEAPDSGRFQSGSVLAVSNRGDKIAYTSQETDELILSNVEGAEPSLRIPVKAALVSYLNFDASDELLYVTFANNKVESYHVKDFTLAHTYLSLKGEVNKLIQPKKTEYTIVSGSLHSYLLDQDKSVIAHLYNLKEILPDKRELVISSGNYLATVPIYDFESLMKASRMLVGEKILTDIQKRELHIK